MGFGPFLACHNDNDNDEYNDNDDYNDSDNLVDHDRVFEVVSLSREGIISLNSVDIFRGLLHESVHILVVLDALVNPSGDGPDGVAESGPQLPGEGVRSDHLHILGRALKYFVNEIFLLIEIFSPVLAPCPACRTSCLAGESGAEWRPLIGPDQQRYCAMIG